MAWYCCIYLVIPLLAALWKFFKLPKFEWKSALFSSLIVLSADVFRRAAGIFAPYSSFGLGSFFSSFFSFLADITLVIGLTLTAFFLLYEALLRL